MRRINSLFALTVFLLAAVPLPAAAAAVRQQLYFTKRVSLLTPRNYQFRFSLWDSQDPNDPVGFEVWNETKTIRLTGRVLRHYLGSVVGFDNGAGGIPVDFSGQLWVQVDRVTGSGNVRLGSRTILGTVPYALWSATAASGGSVTEVVAGDGLAGSVSGSQVTLDVGQGSGIDVSADQVAIASLGVATGMIADGAVTDGKITGPISGSKLGSHQHDGGDIASGTVDESYIDSDVARDSEVVTIVQANDGHGSNIDADLLDGSEASAFATSGHTHDSRYVNVPGDTMTGTLNLPADGLVVGTTQLVLSGGKVGVNTSNPQKSLEVGGEVIRSITRAHGVGVVDPTPVGPLPTRVLNFNKAQGDTGVRVTYTDNRTCAPTVVAPGPVACRWEIIFNGQSCANPGPLVYDMEAWDLGGVAFVQANRNETVTGTCFDLPAGVMSVGVKVGVSPISAQAVVILTGNLGYWALEAEEVR